MLARQYLAPYVSIGPGCTSYIGIHSIHVGLYTHRSNVVPFIVKTRLNRKESLVLFSPSRSCRHGIENYLALFAPLFRGLLVDFIVFTFQGTSFSPRARPVRSSFFPSTRIYFLLLFLYERTPPHCAPMRHESFSSRRDGSPSFSPANRIIDSVVPFSSMNLRLRLCKKKKRRKREEEERKKKISSPWMKPGLSVRCT